MPKFLIDENLSPKIAKHLEMHHGMDAVHVRNLGRTGMPDGNVGELAVRHGRVIISLDRDFIDRSNLPRPRHPGVIRLRILGLHSTAVYLRLLDWFFDGPASELDLDNSVIELTEFAFSVLHVNP